VTGTREYLARFTLALPTFVTLHTNAMGLLPEAQPQKATPEPIEAIISVTEIAAKFKVTQPVVRRELAKLRNFGWISEAGRSCYRLGARIGAKVVLLADVQAEEATGVPGLVSMQVLAIPMRQALNLPAAISGAPIAMGCRPQPPLGSVRHDGRGVNRRWER
jgi:hypothetical protein